MAYDWSGRRTRYLQIARLTVVLCILLIVGGIPVYTLFAR